MPEATQPTAGLGPEPGRLDSEVRTRVTVLCGLQEPSFPSRLRHLQPRATLSGSLQPPGPGTRAPAPSFVPRAASGLRGEADGSRDSSSSSDRALHLVGPHPSQGPGQQVARKVESIPLSAPRSRALCWERAGSPKPRQSPENLGDPGQLGLGHCSAQHAERRLPCGGPSEPLLLQIRASPPAGS